jgi:5-bromo-4-chloroindolyl phosphate hydrolysis protein
MREGVIDRSGSCAIAVLIVGIILRASLFLVINKRNKMLFKNNNFLFKKINFLLSLFRRYLLRC